MIFGHPGQIAIEIESSQANAGKPREGNIRIWIGEKEIGDYTSPEFLTPSILFWKRWSNAVRRTPDDGIRTASPEEIIELAHRACCDVRSTPFFGLTEREVWDLVFVPRCPPFDKWFGIAYQSGVGDDELLVWIHRNGHNNVHCFSASKGALQTAILEFLRVCDPLAQS